MKAGRELDALVAEKVMSWKSFGEHWATENERVHKKIHWHPSTDMAAAWAVVERLTGPKMAFSLITLWDQSKNQFQWIAKVEFWGTDRFEFATTDTASHAICLAALKAVGMPIPDLPGGKD